MDRDNETNIYSEPLYSISQLPSLSSASTQMTQTQDGATVAQFEDRKTRKCNFRDHSDRGYEEEGDDYGQDEDSETSDFDFNLNSIVMKVSKMSQDFCTTGCSTLDIALKGGIPTFGITELYGEAGTGKTQLCLQLAITAQLPKSLGGLDAGGVYYICTEDVLPTKRLTELVGHFKSKFPTDLPENPMNNIFIEHVTEVESLLQCVELKLLNLARQKFSDKKLRLVVMDSVAAIFRLEADDIAKRTEDLRKLAQNLHEYSHDYNAAVVVCNQVTANPNLEGNVASLGMSWKNMVTTRMLISKTDSRFIYVSFSPHLPSIGIPIKIDAVGVSGVPNEQPR